MNIDTLVVCKIHIEIEIFQEKSILYQAFGLDTILPNCCEGHWLAKFDTRKALYWKDPLLYANWSSQK